MKVELPRKIFEKYSNIKFHEKQFIGSRVVSRGSTDVQTDVSKLTVAFRKFCERTSKLSEPSARVAGVPAKNESGHFPSTGL